MKLFLLYLYCYGLLARGGCGPDSDEDCNYISLHDRINELSLTVRHLIGRINNADGTIVKLQSKLSDAKTEIEGITSEQDELKQAFVISQAEYNTSTSQLKAADINLKIDLTSLSEMMGFLNNEVILLSQKDRFLNNEMNSLNESNRLLNTEVISLSEKNRFLNSDVISLNESNRCLNTEVVSLVGNNSLLNIGMISLNAKNRLLSTEVIELNNQLEDMKTSTEANLVADKKLKQALIISQSEFNTSIGRLKAEGSDLKLQVTSLYEKNRLLNTEVISLIEKNRLLNTELVELNNQLAEMKNSTEVNLDTRNKIVTDEIEMLKKMIEDLRSYTQWITIQRRGTKLQDGVTRQTFDLGWVEYANGFGNSSTNDFWLGLDKIAQLTRNGDYELRVDLVSRDTGSKYASYKSFQVSNATDNYRLKVSGHSGTAGDALVYSNNQEFTTKDRDNDNWDGINCAIHMYGAWWHDYCSYATLNDECGAQCKSLRWTSNGYLGRDQDISFSEMKIKRHF